MSEAKTSKFDVITTDSVKRCGRTKEKITSEIKRSVSSAQTCLTTSKTTSNLAALATSSPTSNLYPSLKEFDNYDTDICDQNVFLSTKDKITDKTDLILKSTNTSPCRTPVISQPVTVTGQNISLEIEKGGKVLFILGENEKLEGLKNKKDDTNDLKFSVDNSKESDINIVKEGDKYTDNKCTKESESTESGPITALAIRTGDFLRTVPFRRQGKSATTLDQISVRSWKRKFNRRPHTPPFIYPSLETLKKELVPIPSTFYIKIPPNKRKTHRRNRSDPIHGAFLDEMPPYAVQFLDDLEERVSPVLVGDALERRQKTDSHAEEKISVEEINIPR